MTIKTIPSFPVPASLMDSDFGKRFGLDKIEKRVFGLGKRPGKGDIVAMRDALFEAWRERILDLRTAVIEEQSTLEMHERRVLELYRHLNNIAGAHGSKHTGLLDEKLTTLQKALLVPGVVDFIIESARRLRKTEEEVGAALGGVSSINLAVAARSQRASSEEERTCRLAAEQEIDAIGDALGVPSGGSVSERARRVAAELKELSAPIPARLRCPSCGSLHIDKGEWVTRPHCTHVCEHCGEFFRVSNRPTVGIAFLPGTEPFSPATKRVLARAKATIDLVEHDRKPGGLAEALEFEALKAEVEAHVREMAEHSPDVEEGDEELDNVVDFWMSLFDRWGKLAVAVDRAKR